VESIYPAEIIDKNISNCALQTTVNCYWSAALCAAKIGCNPAKYDGITAAGDSFLIVIPRGQRRLPISAYEHRPRDRISNAAKSSGRTVTCQQSITTALRSINPDLQCEFPIG